jgi:hypothetical protein
MILGVVGVNAALKLCVLHHTRYEHFLTIGALLHLLVSTVVEHIIFVLSAAVVLWLSPNARYLMNGPSKLLRKIYLALAFPEIFKFTAVLLQMFDNEATILLLIGALITSVQLKALQSVTNVNSHRLIMIISAAVVSRVVVRLLFYQLSDIYLLGFIS